MNNEKRLIPNYRFPDFKDDKEWTESSVGDLYDFYVTNSFSRDNLTYDTGTVKNIHYGDIHTKFSTLFDIQKEKVPFVKTDVPIEKIKPENYCIEGDIIFADASEDLHDIGKSIEIVNLNNEKLLAGLHTLLARQKEPKLITGFGGYLFKSNSFRKQIQKVAQGAKVLGITASRISKIKIAFPQSHDEQQKIVSCLSSLDDVLKWENQKLDLLKEHKKGLIQNLFPQKGEAIPKFRFPHFISDGDWSEKLLFEVANYENGKAHEQDIDSSGGWIVVNSKFISTEGKIVKYSNTAFCPANVGDILMVLSDVPNGKAIGKCFYIKEDNKFTVNQRICKITPFDCNNLFLYYTMNRNAYFLSFDDGLKQTNLRTDEVQNFPFLLPSDKKEQEMIANCLSSIDAMVVAQIEKIEQLNQHKKGLMQGLFLNLN